MSTTTLPHRRRSVIVPIVAVISALLLAASGASAQNTTSSITVNGTCTPNPSYVGICTRFAVTYPISLTPAEAQATETGLISSAAQLEVLKVQLISWECGALLQSLVCAQTFPSCPSTQATPQFACRSSCQLAATTCAPVFLANNIHYPLPDCNNATDVNYARTQPFADDVSNPVTATCVSSEANLASVQTDISCPFPYIRNPYWPDRTAPTEFCNGPCCAPCPIASLLHAPGVFDRQVLIHQIVHFIAFLLSLYVVVSYSILPGRRDHPADIVLHFAIASAIWMAVSLWTLPSVRRIQCSPDGVTPSSAMNNTLCGAQAAWLLVGVHATVLWGAYMIWNLHFTIVHKSSILARYKPLGIILCWGVPILLTVITLMADTVDASTGPICFVSSKAAIKYVFGVQGFIMVPTMVVNVYTFLHIARVAKLAGSSSASAPGASSGTSSVGSADGLMARPISRRRQLLQLVKMNWRALLLGVVFLSTYITYFAFYTIVTNITTTATPDNPWVVDFFACMVSLPRATAQATCSKMFESNLPPNSLLLGAYTVTGVVGAWVFIVFGLQAALVTDWIVLFKGLWTRRRTGQVAAAAAAGSTAAMTEGKWNRV
ncbi:hypothetical protein HKX48_000396 [Thoreauomyces humboldtii]|nr:hypothetical protein HKX48_000396 [Thoreauomyces humboldtii]